MANIRFGVATAQRGWAEPAGAIDPWPLARLRRFVINGRSPGVPGRALRARPTALGP